MRNFEVITSKSLSDVLGVSERTVQKRAKDCEWAYVCQQSKSGRPSHMYLFSALPDEVQAAAYFRMNARPAGQAGIARARELAEQAAMARSAREAALADGLARYAKLPKKRQRLADARMAVLQARDGFVAATDMAKKRATHLFIKEFAAGNVQLPQWVSDAIGPRGLSWATLYRWERAYQECGLAGLAGRTGKKRGTSLSAEQRSFVEAMLVKFPHATIPHIKNGMAARFDGASIPSDSSIRRFVQRWKRENASLFLYLTNPDAWKNANMLAVGDASESVSRLNQIWEYDSTPGDVMLTDGRHSLIGVIDIYSRRAKLLVSPTSKSAAIAALTRRALMDWGVPESVKTDNGSDYVSKHLVRVFESLQIAQILCTPFSPEQKPHIERFFHTFSHGIVELLPGYIGHSVPDRQAIEARRSFAQRLMSQGDDPVEINMTAEEFQRFCDRWCAAVYEQNPHSSLNGMTPLDMARQWRAPVRRIEDERALDLLLLPAPDNDGIRTIGKKGIKVEGDYFIAPEIGPYVGRQVFCLIDQADYGTIYVYVLQDDGSKTYLCKAVNPLRTGHDRAEIAAKARAVQNRFMAEGRKRLKAAARQAGVDAIGEEILSYRESQRAKMREFPKPSEKYTTPDLEQAALAVEDVRREQMGPQPYGISPDQDTAAGELIDMVARRNDRPLPATAQEKYEQLQEDLAAGADLSDAELAFMKRHEMWLENGDEAAL